MRSRRSFWKPGEELAVKRARRSQEVTSLHLPFSSVESTLPRDDAANQAEASSEKGHSAQSPPCWGRYCGSWVGEFAVVRDARGR